MRFRVQERRLPMECRLLPAVLLLTVLGLGAGGAGGAAAAAQADAPAAPAPAVPAPAVPAQSVPAQAATRAPAPAAAVPAITNVRVGTATDLGVPAEHQPAHLGSWLTIEVTGLEGMLEKARAGKKPLELYLNGMPISGIPSVYLFSQGRATGIRYALLRTDDSDVAWSALLGKPRAERRQIGVSVGVAGCTDTCTDITDAVEVPLAVIRPAWLWGFIVVLIAGVWAFIRLARTTPLLRDHGAGSPWSLGRVQMAWWSLFVVASFVFIWMVTGSYGSLTSSVLALIGISAGTGLLGAVMDDGKQAQVKKRQALEAELGSLPAGGDGDREAQIKTELAGLPRSKPSSSFLLDILSDENGISFHRLQVAIWTVVLTVIFLQSVYVHLGMPEFDTQLLALMGISNGTYLGFKIPEKQV